MTDKLTPAQAAYLSDQVDDTGLLRSAPRHNRGVIRRCKESGLSEGHGLHIRITDAGRVALSRHRGEQG